MMCLIILSQHLFKGAEEKPQKTSPRLSGVKSEIKSLVSGT
jgi:hypothetical protein